MKYANFENLVIAGSGNVLGMFLPPYFWRVPESTESSGVSSPRACRVPDRAVLIYLCFLCVAGLIGSHFCVLDGLSAEECLQWMGGMAQVCGTSLSELMARLSPREARPTLLEEAGEWLKALPMVSDWVRRSAFRRGAVTALSLGLTHFPEDFDPAEVTSGYPPVTGGVTEQHVQSLYDRAVPYAQRVLDMG